jgi:hypothetical protein
VYRISARHNKQRQDDNRKCIIAEEKLLQHA